MKYYHITTSKGYVYYNAGLNVNVGDTVILPSKWRTGTYTDTVAKLGGSYIGEVKSILGVEKKAGTSVTMQDILSLAVNAASNITIDGATYVKQTVWVRQ